MDEYKIGEKIWFKGEEYTVSTKGYRLWGHMWQDATQGDKVVTVPTPGQVALNVARLRAEYRDTQEGFKRLKALKKRMKAQK